MYFTFDLYRLVNFNSVATILAVVADKTIYSKVCTGRTVRQI